MYLWLLMRLGNLHTREGIKPVAIRDGSLLELSDSISQLLGRGSRAITEATRRAKRSHALDESKLAPAVLRPGKILCIGKNYADHAEELGGEAPGKPEVFMRAWTSLCGPYQPLARPHVSPMMDYEVELAVVIGKPGRYIRAEGAWDHVGGYSVFNDVSIRDFQNFGQQWTPGKNFDGLGPLGPWVVTPDEVSRPQELELSTTVVGLDGKEELLQHSNTKRMVHGIADLIAYLSLFTTLEAGDVIATGTPSGVAMARQPQRWLTPGETVICRVEGLGETRNLVVAEARPNP